MIIMCIVVFSIMTNCLIFAEDRPILVFSSIKFQKENGGALVPEIAINADGTCRQATIKDVSTGQEFELLDDKENPKSQGKVIANSFKDDYYVGFDAKDTFYSSVYYWGLYKAKQQFELVGQGEELKARYEINGAVQKALLDPKKDIEERLENGIKADWANIQRQFPELGTSNIAEFMVGDVNGDGKEDYVLILGDFSEIEGGAAILYLSNERAYSMIPINFWKYASYSESWPRLFFMMDFNGDGMQEIVITNSDSDSNYPKIYGWFKDRQALMMLYNGKQPFYAW